MPRVASETSAVHSAHHGLGSRRPPSAETKPPSTPFEMLLEDSNATPPPSPHDHPERTRSNSTTDAANDTRPDQRSRRENRADDADGRDRAERTDDAQQPDAETKPDETSATETADPAEGSGDEEEAVATDTIEVLLLAADAQAPQPSEATEQAPAMPVATLVQPAETVDTGAGEFGEAADAAINAAGARNAPGPGVNGGADAGAEIDPEQGTKNPAGAGSADAATQAGAGDAGETGRKGTGVPNAANGPDPLHANKTPRAKPGPRSENAAPTGTEHAARDRGSENADAAAGAVPDATGKGEHAGSDAMRQEAQNAAPKPDAAASRLQADPHSGPAADGGKPAIDPAQLASLHPADRFAGVAAAAQGGLQTGVQGSATGSATVPIAALAVEIAARAQAGGTRFEIRLDPPELGRIDVRLDVDRSGQVTTRLVVEKSETLDFLRRDSSELERALQQAGLKTGDNGLQFSLRDQTAGGQDSRENWRSNSAKLVVSDPEMTAVETAAAGYGRSLRVGGGIDIRV